MTLLFYCYWYCKIYHFIILYCFFSTSNYFIIQMESKTGSAINHNKKQIIWPQCITQFSCKTIKTLLIYLYRIYIYIIYKIWHIICYQTDMYIIHIKVMYSLYWVRQSASHWTIPATESTSNLKWSVSRCKPISYILPENLLQKDI